MKNISYCFLFIFILVNIGKSNSKFKKRPNLNIFHPLKLHYDFSNLENNEKNSNLISVLNEARDILSKLIYTNNNQKININPIIMKKFKTKLSFKNVIDSDNDIIILPLRDKLKRNIKYKIEFCKTNMRQNKMPSIVVLYIDKNLNFKSEDENSKYELILTTLKIVTDCLGLYKSYLKKKRFFRNNFFETPYYLMYGYNKSSNSLEKIYILSGKNVPEKNISLNGNFYLSSYNKDFIVQDFRSEIIDIKGDISEFSMNFFNDIQFYSVARFDYEYIGDKKKCYRVDQKCLNETELDKFYINYGIDQEKNNEIICYLSDSNNIKLNQCGKKYSRLIEQKTDFCPLISKKRILEREIIKNKIPDLVYYNNQTLHLLKPSPKCHEFSPRTIYFKSFEREENLSDIYQIENITLDKKQENYFVTYLTETESYFNIYVNILNKNGLIRSYYHNNEHNLYIKGFDQYFLKNVNKNGNYFNEYQKLYHFMGVEVFFFKNLLYENYHFMKLYFKAYNYMPLTYEYPKDKEKIEKKFKNYKLNIKNLWIVKPINLFGGKGIHIFKSLKEENEIGTGKYLISKYLSKPHLINGKKYDMRLYVLITGFQPLKIYLYKEGLIRIAADKYKLSLNSINNKFSHLTNTAINIESNKYVNPKTDSDEKANKWNIKTYRNYLKRNNIDDELLFDKIKDIVIKTLISGQRKIKNKTEELNLNDINIFNLFGFDIFINNEFNPYLLEVNTRPFMKEYNKYDKIIKSNLFVDTLNIVGLQIFSHSKDHKTFDKIFNYKDKIKQRVDDSLCELTRPRGDYELIFPLKDNIEKYKRFFFKKKGKENVLFWKEIIKDE